MNQQAVETLFNCLTKMAEQNSNPVLQVLENQAKIVLEKKYPKGMLQFSGAAWQAFYHCHTNKPELQKIFEAEHGHFHIFAKFTEQPVSWTHVVALSMDSMGQPLRWFTVNHWVTDEAWTSAESLINILETINYCEQTTVLTQWLLVMLSIYKPEISDLLLQRDKLLAGQDKEAFFKNREIYLLTEQAIKLEDKLEQFVL